MFLHTQVPLISTIDYYLFKLDTKTKNYYYTKYLKICVKHNKTYRYFF